MEKLESNESGDAENTSAHLVCTPKTPDSLPATSLKSSVDSEVKTWITFLDLPWEDVIFPLIMPCLPLQNQFKLRAVSRQFRDMVAEYFRMSDTVNIARIAGKLSVTVFEIMTKDSYNLQTMNLRNAKDWLTDKVLMPVLKGNARLTLIDLTNCSSLTNSSMQILAVNCHKVKTLVLRDCHWLSVEGLIVIAMNCRDLQRVDLTGCWNLNDEAISMLVMHCKKLKYLSLAKIYSITDDSLSVLAKETPCLHHLNVQGCWRISDDSVRLLSEFCHSLVALQIRECRDVTETTLSRLRERKVKIDVRPPVQYRRVDMLHQGLRHRLNVQI